MSEFSGCSPETELPRDVSVTGEFKVSPQGFIILPRYEAGSEIREHEMYEIASEEVERLESICGGQEVEFKLALDKNLADVEDYHLEEIVYQGNVVYKS